MKLKTYVEWSNPDKYRVVVMLPGGTLHKAMNVMNVLGIPAAKPPSYAGWHLDEGSLVLTGTQTAVEKAIESVEYAIIGPRFESGLEVAQRRQRGALL